MPNVVCPEGHRFYVTEFQAKRHKRFACPRCVKPSSTSAAPSDSGFAWPIGYATAPEVDSTPTPAFESGGGGTFDGGSASGSFD